MPQKRKLEPIDDNVGTEDPIVGAVPWKILRIKLRNPNLKDLPRFMETLTNSDKLQLLKLMEEDFARLHYYYNKLVPDSYRTKDGKSDLIQLSYDQLKNIGVPYKENI